MKEKYHLYNPRLKEFAKSLRNNSTKAEVRLWTEVLKASKTGFKFNRQRPIDRFIVDFFCPAKRLIIEVDGWTHEDPDIVEKDRLKDSRLVELGYEVLRFYDYQIHDELDNVRDSILTKLNG